MQIFEFVTLCWDDEGITCSIYQYFCWNSAANSKSLVDQKAQYVGMYRHPIDFLY